MCRVGRRPSHGAQPLDFSTLLLGAALTILPLIGAGLLAALVLLERPEPAIAGGPVPRRPRRRNDSRDRRCRKA